MPSLSNTLQCQVCCTDSPIVDDKCCTCEELLPVVDARMNIFLRRLDLHAKKGNTITTQHLKTVRDLFKKCEEKYKALRMENEKLRHQSQGTTKSIPPPPPPPTPISIPEEEIPEPVVPLNANLRLVDADNFIPGEFIAQSSTCQIQRGILHGMDVVCKKLINISNTPEIFDKFMSSMQMTTKLAGGPAECIMTLQGVAGTNSPNPVMFMPYMEHKDLFSRMLDYSMPALTEQQKLQIAFRVIKGIVDIHALNLMHRDINPTHVLLDRNDEAKLSGLSNVREVATMMTAGVGMKRYAAPETFISDEKSVNKYTEKADIYSFGMLLVYMFTGKHPFSHIVDKKGKTINDMAFMNKIMNNEVDTTSHPCITSSPHLIKLIKRCTTKDGEHRPSAIQVMNRIKELLFDDLPTAPTTRPEVNAIVTVVYARNIHSGDPFGQDVRCDLQVDTVYKQTNYNDNGGINPTWNETFVLNNVHLMDDLINFNIRKRTLVWFSGDLGCTSLKMHLAFKSESHQLQINYRGREEGTLFVTIKLDGDVRGWLHHYITNVADYFTVLGGRRTDRSDDLQPKLQRAQDIFAQLN